MRAEQDLEADRIQAINGLLFIQDNPIRADATIVLGMSLWQRPLEAALALYRSGLAGKLVFTGGHNSQIGGAEGQIMMAQALARGVNPAMAMCEDRASHTRENFTFSWNMLKALGEPVSAVNIIGIHYHIRRALLTARDVLPAGIRLGHVSYPSLHFTPGNWHACERGRRDVLKEVAKLASYYPYALQGPLP